MKLQLFQVDAFASSVFGGNPAAVVPLDAWLPDALMQAIAAENNLSETAFFTPLLPDDQAEYHLRWFTPKIEVPLCGHATLASAHVLRHHLDAAPQPLSFQSCSGLLLVRFQDDLIVLDFPASGHRPMEVTPQIVEALGDTPAELYEAYSDAHEELNVMAVFETEDQVRRLEPNIAQVARIGRGCMIVTAPGRECDFVSRYFAPGAGIAEDPVTGSSHCVLTPYWSNRCGKDSLIAHQISERGGVLTCWMRGDRVHIGGHAVTYLTGTIEV